MAPTVFPDYNFYYLPFRHLVLQGPVPNPRVPASSLVYPNNEALVAAFQAVGAALMSPNTSRVIAQRMASFLTDEYYYMYRLYNFAYHGEVGVAGYRLYLLEEPGSIKASLLGQLDQMQLLMDGKPLSVL